MDRHEYRFKIDAFRPDTLPMKRFAEYVNDLARLLGHESDVHFGRIEDGSVEAVILVDGPAQPKVAKRLLSVVTGDGEEEAMAAFKDIDKRLASDNAVGVLRTGAGDNIIAFPGRNRPPPIEYPAFSEAARLEGTLVSLGGRDDTKHAQLDNGGDVITRIQTKDTELLQRLRSYLFGPPIRLIGQGRFQRTAEGEWVMKSFQIHEFEPLEAASFEETVAKLRSVPGGIKVTADVLSDLKTERGESEN